MLRPFLQIAAALFCIEIAHAVVISPDSKAARIGGCVVNDKLIHCAAIAVECEEQKSRLGELSWKDEPMTYKSATELAKLGLECTTDNLRVGTCSEGECAITEDSCSNPAGYESPKNYGNCNAEGVLLNGIYVPTQYGGCKHRVTNAIVCTLTPDDCTVNEDWIPASDVEREVKGGCLCNDVRVGFCSTGNMLTSICSISADDCDPFLQIFFSARDNDGKYRPSLVDCRLCPMGPSEQDVSSHNISDDIKIIEEKEADALHTGEIVGIVLGSLLTVFFAVVGLFMYHSNSAVEEYLHVEHPQKEGKESETVPEIS